MIRRLGALIAVLCLVLAPATGAPRPPAVEIETAKTWVGFARVTLAVDHLTVAGDALEGDYEIRISLAPLLNDRGRIRFDLEQPLETTLEQGGTITGNSYSTDGGKVRPISCNVQPGGRVQIQVDTGNRKLLFKSRIRTAA